jgi:hypothetical protein
MTQTVKQAQAAVTRLVEECRKGGPLYVQNPPAVAQVSRTAKWLLNALERLNQQHARRISKPTA